MKTFPKLLAVPALLLLANCGRAQDGKLAECEAAANSGDARKAVEACTLAIESHAPAKDRAYAYSYRAGALNFLGRSNDAEADLDASVRLAPANATILANRGAIYNVQGRLDLAARDLDSALKLDPDNVLALGNLGILHSKRGEWADAHRAVERALELEPKNLPLLGERCWIGAASAPDPLAALPDCDRVVETANLPNDFNSRGLARYRAGKFAEAIEDYDRSLKGAPGVGSSWYMRGMAKRAAGVAGAQEDIDKGLSIEPGVADRYAGYGVTRS